MAYDNLKGVREMKNLDEVFDIYQSFLDSVNRDFEWYETVKSYEDGKEIMILNFLNGFKVVVTNDKNVENSAEIRCWWNDESNAVEINSLEELFQKFYNHD